MKYASILELSNIDELSSFDMNMILGGETNSPIVVDNGNTGITSLWMDTGIRP